VNLVLVVDGWAWHYKKYAGEQSSSDRLLYASAEEDARSQRSGLWSDPHAIPPWDWRAGAR
jgi:endonuclease YncB( thermonuclease family)